MKVKLYLKISYPKRSTEYTLGFCGNTKGSVLNSLDHQLPFLHPNFNIKDAKRSGDLTLFKWMLQLLKLGHWTPSVQTTFQCNSFTAAAKHNSQVWLQKRDLAQIMIRTNEASGKNSRHKNPPCQMDRRMLENEWCLWMGIYLANLHTPFTASCPTVVILCCFVCSQHHNFVNVNELKCSENRLFLEPASIPTSSFICVQINLFLVIGDF